MIRADVSEILRPAQTRPRYGALLLPLGSARESERLTRAAVVLANQLNARLIGLTFAPVDGWGLRTETEQDVIQLLLEAAGARFEALTREVRAGRRWRRCDGPLFETLREHAWSADVMLLGDARLRHRDVSTGLREMMRCTATPVVIWPEPLGPRMLTRAVVLCDESPASLRAVRSAAPILSRCSSVTLMGVGTHALQVKRGLEARGVADVRLDGSEAVLSHAVAERLSETPADIIVAGAWPEPLRGWPKRSITDILLGNLATPLFMAT